VANLSLCLQHLTRKMAVEALANLSDQQLIETALAGRDEAVFDAIVQRHGAMVYRVCWRVLRHEQDSEDAFQATFLVLARKLRSVRKRASLASWLHGVAYRVALQSKDKAYTYRRHEKQAAVHQATHPDDVTWRELRETLDAELERLPEKWRLPLILCYLEGRTQDEAAKLLGWSKNTLRSRLDEARDALARRLTRRGIVWEAALSAVLVFDCVASAVPSPELVFSTVQAVAHVAAGRTTGAAISAKVTALTEGMVKPMLLTKLNTAMAGLLVLGLLAFGAGSVPRGTGGAARADQPEKPSTREKAADPLPKVDLAKIDRTIRKEPAYHNKPRYCLLVLGQKAETRIWLVIDGETLFVDRNGNGNLTEEGKQLAGKRPVSPGILEFHVGPFTEADGKTKHSDLIVYEYFARQYGHLVNTVAVMDVLGIRGQTTNGEDDCAFADSPKDAPIIHINGPLTMMAYHVWVESHGGTWSALKEVSYQSRSLIDFRNQPNGKDVPYQLKVGDRVSKLHVKIGTPGVGRGTFAALAVENNEFPGGIYPVAVIAVPTKANPSKMVNVEYILNNRCCGTQFYGPVALPEGADGGNAKITLSFPAWKEGKVSPAVVELPMVGPSPAAAGKGSE
jgi:RNA polymerase sigma factor (sigma-70 family)